jgi:hypothetical protein
MDSAAGFLCWSVKLSEYFIGERYDWQGRGDDPCVGVGAGYRLYADEGALGAYGSVCQCWSGLAQGEMK